MRELTTISTVNGNALRRGLRYDYFQRLFAEEERTRGELLKVIEQNKSRFPTHYRK